MALIDRVKERTGTSLSDDELQALIAEITGDIEKRYGPLGEITKTLEGGASRLFLDRPIGDGDVDISETVNDEATVLDPADFRVWHGGRTLERTTDGPNPRRKWGNRVAITYTPLDDAAERDEVVIKVVQLTLEFSGTKSESIDNYSLSRFPDYRAERERLIASLGPSALMS